MRSPLAGPASCRPGSPPTRVPAASSRKRVRKCLQQRRAPTARRVRISTVCTIAPARAPGRADSGGLRHAQDDDLCMDERGGRAGPVADDGSPPARPAAGRGTRGQGGRVRRQRPVPHLLRHVSWRGREGRRTAGDDAEEESRGPHRVCEEQRGHLSGPNSSAASSMAASRSTGTVARTCPCGATRSRKPRAGPTKRPSRPASTRWCATWRRSRSSRDRQRRGGEVEAGSLA